MKKLATAIAIIASIGTPAFAADMVLKAAPVVTPPFSWSGPYIGGEGGGGWGQSGQSDPGPPPAPPAPVKPPPVTTHPLDIGSASLGVSGGLIGGTAGYNWQAGPWVLGIEGDYSWDNIQGSSGSCGFAPPHGCGTSLESFGTLRGRVGYAMGDRGTWLPYATGGLAVGEVHAWDALTPASGSAFRAGWTVGGGIETVLAPNWTFKIEYLYIDLGSAHLFDIVPGVPETVSFRDNILRIGINYKFW